MQHTTMTPKHSMHMLSTHKRGSRRLQTPKRQDLWPQARQARTLDCGWSLATVHMLLMNCKLHCTPQPPHTSYSWILHANCIGVPAALQRVRAFWGAERTVVPGNFSSGSACNYSLTPQTSSAITQQASTIHDVQ